MLKKRSERRTRPEHRMEVTDRRRVTRNRPVELAWSTRRNLLCINDFHPTGRRGRDSAGRGPSLSRCPPGGSLQGNGTAAAAGGRLSVSGSGPLRKQAFDGPETKNSRLLSQPAAVPLSCGESENRKPSTTPFVNPCRSAFYCVSLQTGSLTFEHLVLSIAYLCKRVRSPLSIFGPFLGHDF